MSQIITIKASTALGHSQIETMPQLSRLLIFAFLALNCVAVRADGEQDESLQEAARNGQIELNHPKRVFIRRRLLDSSQPLFELQSVEENKSGKLYTNVDSVRHSENVNVFPGDKEEFRANAPYPQQAPYPAEAPYPKEAHLSESGEEGEQRKAIVAADIDIRRAVPFENDHINHVYDSKLFVPASIKIINEQIRNLVDPSLLHGKKGRKENHLRSSPVLKSKLYSYLAKKMLENGLRRSSSTGNNNEVNSKKLYDDGTGSFQPLVYLPWWLQPENKQYTPFSQLNSQPNPPANRMELPSSSPWWLQPNSQPFSKNKQSVVDLNRQAPAVAPWWLQPGSQSFSPPNQFATNRDVENQSPAPWWLQSLSRPFSTSSPQVNKAPNTNRQVESSAAQPWWLQAGAQPFSSSQHNQQANLNREISYPVTAPWWLQQNQAIIPTDARGEPLFSPPAGGGPSSGFNMEVSEIAEPAFIVPETVEKVAVTIPPPFAPLRTHGLTINDGDLARTEVRKDNGEFVSSFTSSDGTSRSDLGTLVPTADGTDSVLVLKGSYSFTTPEGLKFRVDYTADETGYHAKQYPVTEEGSEKQK